MRSSAPGSFHSEQADWATSYLRDHPDLEQAVTLLLERGTPCFEIISPVSQIVKVYSTHGLICHGLIDRRTGQTLPLHDQWPGPVAQVHDLDLDLPALAALDWANEEGFVVRFASGALCKVKFPGYVALHGLVTGTTTRMLWEHLAVADLRDTGVPAAQAVSRLQIDHRFVQHLYQRTGDPVAALLDAVPDEFDGWVREQVTQLRTRYAHLDAQYRAEFAALPDLPDRKALAAVITTQPKQLQGVLFALLAGQDIRANVWAAVRPESGQGFFAGNLDN